MIVEQALQGRIRQLNDAFRAAGPGEDFPQGWVLTPGVIALGPAAVREAVELVRNYAAFTPDNDPYGEHDFGAFQVRAQKMYWQIDYYDPKVQYQSGDQVDEFVAKPILTIYLPSE